LLWRQPKIKSVTFHQPQFMFVVDSAGRRSWDMSGWSAPDAPVNDSAVNAQSLSQSSPAGRTDRTPAVTGTALVPRLTSSPSAMRNEAARQRLLKRLDGLALRDVRVIGGRIDFRDLRDGTSHTATDVEASLAMKSLEHTLRVEGRGVWHGQQVKTTIGLGSLAAFLTEQTTDFAINATAPPATVSYEGRLAVAEHVSFDGRLAFTAPALSGFVAWVTEGRYRGEAIERAAFAGQILAVPNRVSVNTFDFDLAGARTTGSLTLEDASGTSSLRGDIKASAFDFSRLGEAVAAISALRGSQSSNRLRGPTQGSAQAGAPMRGLSADVRLGTSSATWRGLRLGTTTARVTLDDSKLGLEVIDANLYGGRAKGKVVTEIGVPSAQSSADLSASQVAVGDLLTDFVGTPWVMGQGGVTLAVTTTGGSPEAIVSSLTGKAKVSLAHGSIGGFNLTEFIKGALRSREDKAGRTPNDRTEFTDFSASFVLGNGVAETQDMILVAPQFRLSGVGTVAFPTRHLDMSIRPRSVTIPGVGATLDLARLDVPITIKGPWSKPTVTVDNRRLQAVMRTPERAGEVVKDIGKGIANSKLGRRIEELMTTKETGPDGEQRRLKPREILERLLKKPAKSGDQAPAPEAPAAAPPVAQPK